VTAIDLVVRCLIIERKEAIRYGFDPAASAISKPSAAGNTVQIEEYSLNISNVPINRTAPAETVGVLPRIETTSLPDTPLSLYAVLKVFLKSVRAIATIYNTSIYT
jgi:hypothetical protein